MTAPSLAYAGRLNTLFGPSGGGKTWLALLAMAQVIDKGGHAAVVDYEDHPNGWALRLVQLGADPDAVSERFTYLKPSGDVYRSIETLRRLGHEYAIVVVDSVGEALSASGGDGDKDKDVAPWMVTAKLACGLPGNPGVLLIDHTTKASEDAEGPTMYAAGSQRKRAAVNGAAYFVETIRAASKGQPGLLKITTTKDRHGNRAARSVAAMAELEPCDGLVGGCLRIRLVEPKSATDSDGRFRPTGLMEKVSKWLELNPGASGRQIGEAVRGNERARRAAVEVLVDEGFVTADRASRAIAYTSTKPYREADDTGTATDRDHRDQTATRPRPGRGPESQEIDRDHRDQTPDVVGSGVVAVDCSGGPKSHPQDPPTATMPTEPVLDFPELF